VATTGVTVGVAAGVGVGAGKIGALSSGTMQRWFMNPINSARAPAASPDDAMLLTNYTVLYCQAFRVWVTSLMDM